MLAPVTATLQRSRTQDVTAVCVPSTHMDGDDNLNVR